MTESVKKEPYVTELQIILRWPYFKPVFLYVFYIILETPQVTHTCTHIHTEYVNDKHIESTFIFAHLIEIFALILEAEVHNNLPSEFQRHYSITFGYLVP